MPLRPEGHSAHDRWKSALGFWGGEGGSGDAVSEHLEKHMEDGGREVRVSEKRGEEAVDEGVAGQGGRQGKGPKFWKKVSRSFFILFIRIDNLLSWLLCLSVHSDGY